MTQWQIAAPSIVLDPCYPEEGEDEHGNCCERGFSGTACARCGTRSQTKRTGWWIVFHDDTDLFYCDRCVTTHYPCPAPEPGGPEEG